MIHSKEITSAGLNERSSHRVDTLRGMKPYFLSLKRFPNSNLDYLNLFKVCNQKCLTHSDLIPIDFCLVNVKPIR